jgi:hypothetical protein
MKLVDRYLFILSILRYIYKLYPAGSNIFTRITLRVSVLFFKYIYKLYPAGFKYIFKQYPAGFNVLILTYLCLGHAVGRFKLLTSAEGTLSDSKADILIGILSLLSLLFK